MTEPIEKITLHVPRSPDNKTEFGRVADILDHLATTYGWHPDVFGFLVSRSHEARNMDRVYNEPDHLKPVTMKDIMDHRRSYPHGCEFGERCDVCVAAGHFKT